ncbi:hypothetical protein Bca52824_035892 [Brassica carinata]|uniref:Wax synthase domain-containing protein n=1 Tax=Brassica carinata TaxID=52824 RepID=A0A8X7S3N7_BRACI|nr:hypothetical protein Bca52824_035892 [Brassica carinata]
MEQELQNLIKVWISAVISISYCYYLTPRIKSGVPRLLSLCPILALFLVLPLCFSSVHLSLITAFFLTWLGNFKLILFSFDKGPLTPVPASLARFICFTCFPIKAQQNPKSQNHLPKLVFATKVAIFGMLLHLYGYRENMSLALLFALYFLHLYLEIEIILSFVKNVVCIFLGCDLEQQSNKPYLATSLQDFWGRRWNLMVPAILRPAVYAPMRRVSERKMSSRWALFPGILAAFIVSGLVHELLFFYLTLGREEEDEGDAAVAAESGGVEATHGWVRVCDRLLVVYTSAYKERRDREIHQRSFIGRWFLYPEVIHFVYLFLI